MSTDPMNPVPVPEHQSGRHGSPSENDGAASSVVVQGDQRGIVSIGHYTTNVIYVEGGFVATPSVLELPVRRLPELTPPARAELFGRDELVTQVVDQLTVQHSVQLYGRPSTGKQAIALAVNGRLAQRGIRGTVLVPQTGQQETLADLYDRLARLLYGQLFLRQVDEAELRAAVRELSAHITLIDCTLSTESLSRLLETFPKCTFLITSQYETLPDREAAHLVQPLTRAAAAELLSAELGLRLGPIGLRNLQFDQAYAMAEGLPQRLLQYAAFIRSSDGWRARTSEEPFEQPGPTDPATVSPAEQAEILAVALSEPARQVLVALETFGTPLSPHWFAPVTGNLQTSGVDRELYDRRLVTSQGDCYQITADAAEAVRSQGWGPASPTTAAGGILEALSRPGSTTQAASGGPQPLLSPPDPHLLLAITDRLNDAQQWATASRFVRASAPLALQTGHRQAALKLYTLGQLAATRAGAQADVEFYLHTGEQTRRLLDGDAITAAAALAILASGPGQNIVAAATGHTPASTGHLTQRIARFGRHALKLAQAKPALAVATAIVVAGGAAGITVAATSGDGGSGKPAGCNSAIGVVDPKNKTDARTPMDLVPYYHQRATGLSGAAAEATDPKVKSALQNRADALNSLADAQQSAGNGTLIGWNSSVSDFSTDGVHPDVVAAQVATTQLGAGIEDLQAVNSVCGLN
ncbi:hypothetical protein E6W39_33155 [Kitasatospora acidiphila]|uniref:Uncharacterized protein n=1 Tax=Kitasatospora acidiphila TaxID=2567942 RepID=A0A540WB08_9ACTN|nr:hypothetical protein [Kitasatospora acidiphila]TQF06186.1 hypothetical protein E6W39_33155 [Kitasatospora acidiphila]